VKFSPLAFLFLTAFSCSAAQPSTPVILISIDTLRADHLGCYQPGRRQSPHIDALAQTSTTFSQVSTPFPLTLPAHVALFTSTFPFANGVEDNGIPLNTPTTTLATVLTKSGYRTAAFIGSFVLYRRFGLSQGFDTYDGPIDLHSKATPGPSDHKRPGEQVAAAAKQWLEHNSSAPFFLFLHFYDLHAPYSLPADPNLRHGETGYQAELAYVDKILGDFFALLDRRGLLQKSLIVLTSDHGEGLGEHGESSHGYFLYQSTLHVPLIIHWPGGLKHPQSRVDDLASLIDVAPTILDAVGLARPAEMHGRSLLQSAAPEVYSETLYARRHFGCASLRSVRSANYKYIDAPKPELYDLSNDPHELRNLYDQQRSKAAALRERVIAIRGNAPSPATKPPSPETAAALRSLGYLSGSSATSRLEPRVDPKDRIADFEKYSQALAIASAGKPAESNAILEKLREKLPDVLDITMSLGQNRQRLGDDTHAIQDFKSVIKLDPTNAPSHFDLGLCYFRLHQRDEAITQFKTALALEPWYTRADEALAEIYIQNKDFPQAREHLNHLLSIDSDSYTAHFNLGIFAALDQDWNEAQRQLLAAVHSDPASPEAHNTLGGIYFQRDDLEAARLQFQDAIRLNPKFAEAHYRLGLVLQKQGKSAEAAQEFRTAQQPSH